MKVIKFGAVWCGPCKSYSKTIEEFKREVNGKVEVVELDVDSPDTDELLSKYGIKSVPTTIFLNEDGTFVKEVGPLSKEKLMSMVGL